MRPYPHFPLLPFHLLSPPDVIAERIGAAAVARIMAEPGPARLEQAMVAFLGDGDAAWVVRKEMHAVYEPRLRAVALHLDPPAAHGFVGAEPGPLGHPLDRRAVADLAAALPETTVWPRFRPTARLVQWGVLLGGLVAFLARLVVLTLRCRWRRRPPVHADVVASNFWTVPVWTALREAAEAQGKWRPDSLLFILDLPGAETFRSGPFATIEPDAFAAPLGPWLREVAVPAVVLAGRVLATASRAPGSAVTLETARRVLSLAWRSLPLLVQAYGLRCRWVLECADESSQPGLRAVVFRRCGARSVRWPYHQNESPGIGLSYFLFDLYLCGGAVQETTYRDQWSPRCRGLAVGQIRNDFRISGETKAAPVLRERIAAELAAGRKLVVFFGSNTTLGFERPVAEALAATLETFAGVPGWLVLVKPKASKSLERLYRVTPELEGRMAAENVITIRYDGSGEPCPAAWVIERMTVGVSVPGSVQSEALVSGRPLLTYWPVVHPTALRSRLMADGLLFSDRAALAAALERIRAGALPPIDLDWYRWALDPYADDHALDRVAATLFGDAPVSRPVPTDVSSQPAEI
ncbi:hypothetical protein [Phaeospirillum tilakii]|uniref:Uncharacterized protein n=1 Tax=Phaeospirillum tilakii TaxID=741673 RepID=A0ABW5CDQ0_9PROT